MTLDLTCRACDNTFELDVTELLDEPRVQCPSCDARAQASVAEGLSDALDALLGQVALLRARFQIFFEVDGDDLPTPHDRDRGARSADEEADEEPGEEDLGAEDDEEPGRGMDY